MPSELELFTATVQRRQLTTPLLLLLASHRPLTFVVGQLLYALAPMGLLLGWENASNWAALLSAPDANAQLTKMLEAEKGNPTPALPKQGGSRVLVTQRDHEPTRSLFPPQPGEG